MDSFLEVLNVIFTQSVFTTILGIFLVTLISMSTSYFLYRVILRKPHQYFHSSVLMIKVLDITCVKVAEGTTYKFRANIFMPNKKGDLEISYSSSSMVGAKDYNVVLKPGQGATGIAWEKKQPIVAKLTKAEDAIEWGLNREEAEKTKNIKAILSIPINHPRQTDRYIGILSIDSEDDASTHFQTKKVIEMAYSVSQQIAKILVGCDVISR